MLMEPSKDNEFVVDDDWDQEHVGVEDCDKELLPEELSDGTGEVLLLDVIDTDGVIVTDVVADGRELMLLVVDADSERLCVGVTLGLPVPLVLTEELHDALALRVPLRL